MNELEQLDKLLKYLIHNEVISNPPRTSEIAKNAGIDVNQNLAVEMLEALKEDKLVTDDYNIIKTTFKGRMFSRSGGYQGRENESLAESIRVANVELRQRAYERRMTYLTTILAFGTSIAAWYYFLEICKIYHWFCF